MRCLIADDSQTMRKIIRNNLEKCGIKNVEEANDGAQAIRKFTSMKSVELLFLDINMPIKTGKEVVALLAEKKMIGETKIIIISAELDDDNKYFFLKHRIVNFIPKPFNLDVFNKVVKPLIEPTPARDKAHQISIDQIEKNLNGEEFKVEGKNGAIIIKGKDKSISIDITKAFQAGALEVSGEHMYADSAEEMIPLNEKF